MADKHDKTTRSYNMSRIKGKDTKPEMLVRRFLHAHGFRYRLHAKNLPGKPDVVLPKYNTVIFVNGCFWHQHPNCAKAALPKTRTLWWEKKLSNNYENDQKTAQVLKNAGWKVITIWQCELDQGTLDKLIRDIRQ